MQISSINPHETQYTPVLLKPLAWCGRQWRALQECSCTRRAPKPPRSDSHETDDPESAASTALPALLLTIPIFLSGIAGVGGTLSAHPILATTFFLNNGVQNYESKTAQYLMKIGFLQDHIAPSNEITATIQAHLPRTIFNRCVHIPPTSKDFASMPGQPIPIYQARLGIYSATTVAERLKNTFLGFEEHTITGHHIIAFMDFSSNELAPLEHAFTAQFIQFFNQARLSVYPLIQQGASSYYPLQITLSQ